MSPRWPNQTSPAGITFFGNAHAIASGFKAHGVSHAMAMGALGNFDPESSLDPNALGDFIDANGLPIPWSPNPTGTPTAFGLAQRHIPRIKQIRDGLFSRDGRLLVKGLGFDIQAAVLAKRNTIQNEVEAFFWELNAEPAFFNRAAIMGAATAHDAGYAISINFERTLVGSPEAVLRGMISEEWATYFQQQGWA